MRIIALEEHFWTSAMKDAVQKGLQGYLGAGNAENVAIRLLDLEQMRIDRMNETGVDMQVISHTAPATQFLSADEAIPLARDANDQLATAIKAHPDRYAGFATLPTPAPEAAVQELERAVNVLGFKGAMINGRTGDHFLDEPAFHPILETAAALGVPIYLHPTPPPRVVQDAYYAGFDPKVSIGFATSGWGWHLETGTHALRLILAGIFDRYPSLQIILGHWGEMIPFYLARIDSTLGPTTKHLQRRIADYFTQNFYVTPSGLFTIPPFLLTLQITGADRILYSVDYPYVPDKQARTFLENAPISPADKEKIGHLNAERLLKIP